MDKLKTRQVFLLWKEKKFIEMEKQKEEHKACSIMLSRWAKRLLYSWRRAI